MDILLVEPFFTGSHKAWAEGLQQHSQHNIELLTLPGRHWKWRMHGGAVTLARQFMEKGHKPDLILATDMLDLSTFLALTRERTHDVPTALYFHENQLTYPWSPQDRDLQAQRDNHYSFINYSSAMAADKVLFNSAYHMESLLGELPGFLQQFPDEQEVATVEQLRAKSAVLPLGMNLQKLDQLKPEKIEWYPRALILWNHRWEYDKRPEAFFQALFTLQERGVEFRLAVLGEQFDVIPPVFEEAKERLADFIVHFGYAESEADYAKWLWTADILPVTSNQDFFGGSVVEALYCNTKPLLPKRLAYPEHIPEAYHPQFFYDDTPRDFANKLQRWIFDVRILRKQQTRSFVEHYDWQQMAPVYDKQFERLLA